MTPAQNHLEQSVAQALRAKHMELATAILPRLGDIELYLDRPEPRLPRIDQALRLVQEIRDILNKPS